MMNTFRFLPKISALSFLGLGLFLMGCQSAGPRSPERKFSSVSVDPANLQVGQELKNRRFVYKIVEIHEDGSVVLDPVLDTWFPDGEQHNRNLPVHQWKNETIHASQVRQDGTYEMTYTQCENLLGDEGCKGIPSTVQECEKYLKSRPKGKGYERGRIWIGSDVNGDWVQKRFMSCDENGYLRYNSGSGD